MKNYNQKVSNSKRTSAIILAGGFSSRMGTLKALLPLGDRTVLERSIELFQNAEIEDIVVVTGHRCKDLSAIIDKTGVRRVFNSDFKSGMFTSVLMGIQSLKKESQGFFLLPVDIPLVRPWTVRQLNKIFNEHPQSIVQPCFNGTKGHPPLIPSTLVEDIVDWSGAGGLRGFLEGYENRTITVDLPDKHILMDMDTPEDHRLMLAAHMRHDIPSRTECDDLLNNKFQVNRDIKLHSRLVADIALALGNALVAVGVKLDKDMVYSSSMMHDIAKGNRGHAHVGGQWLSDMGFKRIGAIVASHSDQTLLKGENVTEKTIVYLADKMVKNNNIVSITERFEISMKRYQKNPDAVRNIKLRWQAAKSLIQQFETATGRSVKEILSMVENRFGEEIRT